LSIAIGIELGEQRFGARPSGGRGGVGTTGTTRTTATCAIGRGSSGTALAGTLAAQLRKLVAGGGAFVVVKLAVAIFVVFFNHLFHSLATALGPWAIAALPLGIGHTELQHHGRRYSGHTKPLNSHSSSSINATTVVEMPHLV
jgi:hypothetical protein